MVKVLSDTITDKIVRYCMLFVMKESITPEMEAKFDKSFGDKSSFRGTSFETVISSITGESTNNRHKYRKF